MKLSTKVLLIWLAAIGLMGFSLFFAFRLPTTSGFITYALQILLFIVSCFVVKYEPVRKNKWMFLNFAVFFGLGFYFHAHNFIEGPMARFFLHQYVALGAYFLLLAFAIVYVAIDLLFRDFRTYAKYGMSIVIVGGFFGYYYAPVLVDPLYIHHTDDARDYKALDAFSARFKTSNGVVATVEELSASCQLPSFEKNSPSASPDTKRARVAAIYPYLDGQNDWKVLLLRPLYLNVIHMTILAVGFIMLFFGYQYRKDPPQGAYIEKMMFMLLIFCSLEIFHAWSFVKSVEWESFSGMVEIGQYLSALVLLLVAVFFALRLRFITSINGEFYEQEIDANPGSVTRWRDALDNLVVSQFFSPEKVFGRMFVDPRPR